ncbi:unnamed protein product, partial [Ixodes pacificus]
MSGLSLVRGSKKQQYWFPSLACLKKPWNKQILLVIHLVFSSRADYSARCGSKLPRRGSTHTSKRMIGEQLLHCVLRALYVLKGYSRIFFIVPNLPENLLNT